MNQKIIWLCLGVSLFPPSPIAWAQEEDPAALEELDRARAAQTRPVVEVQGAAELRGAMLRIARSSTDAGAFIDAGNAALLLGDPNAALNFFTRANALQPSNGRIKLGLAISKVRTENPFEALRLFDDSIRLGIPERAVAADRALAFDLLGNFARAQQDYVIAKQADRSNRLIVQHAISIALLGNQGEADALLYPLLQQNYGEAWRARAFLLAARGDFREATRVTQGFMDARSAQQFERYLRQMPQLTGAQKAAAIHLGHFPANNIGRDSDTLQRVAANYPSSGPTGDGRLVPSGDPLGPKVGAQTKNAAKLSQRERERAAKRAGQEVQVPAAIARPVSEVADLGSRVPLPIDIARGRILEAEKASFALVAVLPRVAVAPPIVFKPAAETALLSPAVSQSAAVPPEAKPLERVTIATIPAPQQQAVPVAISGPEAIPPLASVPPQIDSAATTISQPQQLPQSQPLPQPEQTQPQQTQPQQVLSQPFEPAPVPVPVTAATLADVAPQIVPALTDSAPAIINYQDNVAATANVAVTPAATPVVTPPPPPIFDLDAIVSGIDIPEDEKKRDVVPVDLKKLQIAAPKPKEPVVTDDKKSKANTKSSEQTDLPRIWVQVATGSAASFSSDMRIFRRKFADLFKGKDGFSSVWGKSSRLVIGPFGEMKDAKKWEADFRKAGGDGFVWRSEKGVEVTPLKAK
jgi:tetratricopeptide (TPR) repeat protein